MVLAMTVQPRTAPPRPPPRTAPRRTSCFSSRLDAEWTQIRTARRCLLAARRWVADDPHHPLAVLVADATDLDVVIRATQRGVVAGGIRRGDPSPARRAGPPRRAGRPARDPTVAARPHQPGGCTSRLLRDDRSHRTGGSGCVARPAHVRHRASPTPHRGLVDLRRRVRCVQGAAAKEVVGRGGALTRPLRRARVRDPPHRRSRNSPASFVTPDAQVCRRATSSCCGAWPRWSRRAWWQSSAT